MTTEDIIIQIFCAVDDQIGAVAKVPQAVLYPSEVVTIGILFARTPVSDSCRTHPTPDWEKGAR